MEGLIVVGRWFRDASLMKGLIVVCFVYHDGALSMVVVCVMDACVMDACVSWMLVSSYVSWMLVSSYVSWMLVSSYVSWMLVSSYVSWMLGTMNHVCLLESLGI
jgi:hypothetical protein